MKKRKRHGGRRSNAMHQTPVCNRGLGAGHYVVANGLRVIVKHRIITAETLVMWDVDAPWHSLTQYSRIANSESQTDSAE